MSYTKHYLYDVFISYASANNVPPGSGHQGLITEFKDRLTTELTSLGLGNGLKIFFDQRDINDHTPLTDQVLSAARASALMVTFHSQAYDGSVEWCHREFHDWQEANNQDKTRLFVVALDKEYLPTRSALLAASDAHFREFFYDQDQGWYPFDTDAPDKENRSRLTFKNEVFNLARQIRVILSQLQSQSPNKRIFLTCASERQKAAVQDIKEDFIAQGFHVLETSPWVEPKARRDADAEKFIEIADLVIGVEEKFDPLDTRGEHAIEQLEIATRLGKPQLRWLPNQGHGFSEEEANARKSRGEVKAVSIVNFKKMVAEQLSTRVAPPAAPLVPAAATGTPPAGVAAKAPTLVLIVHSSLDRKKAFVDMSQKIFGCNAGSDGMEDNHALGLPLAVPDWQKAIRRAIKEARANKVIILHGGNPRDWIDARLRNFLILADDLEPRPPAALCEYPPLPKKPKMMRAFYPPPGTIDVFTHDDTVALANFVSK